MLPLLNLTTPDLTAHEALQGAGSLVPEDSSALRGRFANILQSTVQPDVALPTVVGEDLPATGKPLPPVASGTAPQLDVDIEIPVADVDLTSLGLGDSAAGGDVSAGLPALVREVVGAADGGVTVVDELPAVMHVPPDPADPGLADPDTTITAAGAAGDTASDALRVPVVAPDLHAADRGQRLKDRDRAIDPTIARERAAGAGNERRVPIGQALANSELEMPVAVRPGGSLETQNLEAPHSRAAGVMTGLQTRLPAESSMAADNALRVADDDGSQVPRPLQPVASQQGTALPDGNMESGQRLHAEIAAAMPRPAAALPAQAATSLPPAAQSIDIPVQQSGWDTAVADRLTLMANGKLQSAEIRLTPADLGPLKIQLDIDDGVANVSFQSQHPLTRDALEQAMPRLRELLAENGLSLGQADVRDDSGQQKSREALTDARASLAPGRDDGESDDPEVTRQARRIADGLVDTFA